MTGTDDPRKVREMMQRIQTGLIGLVGVLLIVSLANFMTRSARVEEAGLAGTQDVGAAANTPANVTATPNEPLADLGVTPSSEPALSGASAVPDLEPDPRLDTPMDRDPRQAAPRQ